MTNATTAVPEEIDEDEEVLAAAKAELAAAQKRRDADLKRLAAAKAQLAVAKTCRAIITASCLVIALMLSLK